MPSKYSSPQRLELTWYNKDKALIPTTRGNYGYTWVNRTDPRYCETHRLVMDEYVEGEQHPKRDGATHSVRADHEPTRDNLMVLGESGDVLEALVRVPELREKYRNQVKLVYIDPPFNTGDAFEGSYEDNLEHSVWLTLMRDRLKNIHELLCSAGSIWVHLDHVENHRMRLLLDEIFGPGNFCAEVVWEKVYSPKMDKGKISVSHDTILVYRKSGSWVPNPMIGVKSKVAFPYVDESGRYNTFPLRKWGHNSLREDAPGSYFPITAPDGTQVLPIRPDGKEGNWRWGPEKIAREWRSIEWKPDRQGSTTPYVKQYEKELGEEERPPVTLWFRDEVGLNREAKKQITDMFPNERPFATPKPEKLMERIIHIGSNPDDIVLDCFGGSGTTAAVAHKMGRRWITCELAESNFKTFMLPRLTSVVRGSDKSGVTASVRRVPHPDVVLPEGVEPDEAREFSRLLNKFAKQIVHTAIDEADESGFDAPDGSAHDQESVADAEVAEVAEAVPDVARAKANVTTAELLRAARTREETILMWRGGGGFQTAHLSPTCFDFDPDLSLPTLTEAGGKIENLGPAVAAHLGYRLTPDGGHFIGRNGRERLHVTPGAVSSALIDELAAHLDEGETMTVAGTAVLNGAAAHARQAVPGSLLLQVPGDIFEGGQR